MSKRKILDTTTHSRTYKLIKHEWVSSNLGLCWFCPPNKGCNYWNKNKPNRNWKNYRKNQYKIK